LDRTSLPYHTIALSSTLHCAHTPLLLSRTPHSLPKPPNSNLPCLSFPVLSFSLMVSHTHTPNSTPISSSLRLETHKRSQAPPSRTPVQTLASKCQAWVSRISPSPPIFWYSYSPLRSISGYCIRKSRQREELCLLHRKQLREDCNQCDLVNQYKEYA
jgi:hypothetical protein